MCICKSFNERVVELTTIYDHSFKEELQQIEQWKRRIHCKKCDEFIYITEVCLKSKICPVCGSQNSFVQRISKIEKYGFLKLKKRWIFNDVIEKEKRDIKVLEDLAKQPFDSFNDEHKLKRKINI